MVPPMNTLSHTTLGHGIPRTTRLALGRSWCATTNDVGIYSNVMLNCGVRCALLGALVGTGLEWKPNDVLTNETHMPAPSAAALTAIPTPYTHPPRHALLLKEQFHALDDADVRSPRPPNVERTPYVAGPQVGKAGPLDVRSPTISVARTPALQEGKAGGGGEGGKGMTQGSNKMWMASSMPS